MYRVGRSLSAACSLALLAACSASDFSKPIDNLASATTDASKSFTGYADSLQTLRQDQNLFDVGVNPSRLVVDGCKRTSTKCELRVLMARGTTQPLKPQFLVHMRQIMAGIASYATNLQAIANADDIAKLKTASDAIPGDINGLAAAVDGLSAQTGRPTKLSAQVAALSTPAGEIITIALTKYAEFEKWRALRSATERMDAIFPEAMAALSEVATLNQELLKTPLLKNYEKERAAYEVAVGAMNQKLHERPQPKDFQTQLANLQAGVRSALDRYNAAADAYNAALTNNPQGTFTKLAEAHSALVKALQMPEPDFQTFFQKIQEVEQIATTVATDAKKIDNALHPKPAA